MKLSEYSKLYNITYKTAWNRYKSGKIKGARLDESGHVVINETLSDNNSENEWIDL